MSRRQHNPLSESHQRTHACGLGYPQLTHQNLCCSAVQLKSLELRKKRALNRWDTRRVSRLSANLYWPWQHVERPHITALNPGLLYGWYPTEDNENHDKTWREIKELVTGELTMPSITITHFNQVVTSCCKHRICLTVIKGF